MPALVLVASLILSKWLLKFQSGQQCARQKGNRIYLLALFVFITLKYHSIHGLTPHLTTMDTGLCVCACLSICVSLYTSTHAHMCSCV